jgi:beta-glucosidase/6-phospho-beta-glucosidase/beta-galactosidase
MTSTTDIKSLKFPSDFHWGYATASAQVEGSVGQRLCESGFNITLMLAF